MTPTSVAATGTGSSASIGTNGSVTFSSCATLSLNGVFNTDYDNYVAVTQFAATTGDWSAGMRIRSAGTDSTTGYSTQRILADNTTVGAARPSTSYWSEIVITDDQRSGSTFYFWGPFLSQTTAIRATNAFGYKNSYFLDIAGHHTVSSSYDGFTLYPLAEAFSGSIAVYGLVGT